LKTFWRTPPIPADFPQLHNPNFFDKICLTLPAGGCNVTQKKHPLKQNSKNFSAGCLCLNDQNVQILKTETAAITMSFFETCQTEIAIRSF
jgi:hypothetical protein